MDPVLAVFQGHDHGQLTMLASVRGGRASRPRDAASCVPGAANGRAAALSCGVAKPKPAVKKPPAAKQSPATKKSPPAGAASAKPTYPEHMFATIAAWTAWLAAHHATSSGIAMRIARKGGTATSINYAEALDVALVWGWIDGQKAGGDEVAWIQRFGPRKPRSIWSAINRAKALALIERGAMQPPGLAAIEQARANGRWDAAYDGPRKATPPADLLAALAAAPRAAAKFETLDANNRFAILHRLQTARQPATRARRLATFVAMLARGETLHPPRASGKRTRT